MQQPVEVQVDEHEPIVERVAAIDVAKASGMVCLRIPHETIPDRRVTKIWPVAATTAALVELGDHLRCERVTRVVVESTSDYWRPFYYLLEAAGLMVWLVNAAQVKNVPGRKSDLLTELPGRAGGRGVRGRSGLARFPRRDQRRGSAAAGAVRAGGAAVRVA